MKDLIIGCIYNYQWDIVKYWVNSLNRSEFAGDKVLLVMGGDKNIGNQLTDAGITVVCVDQPSGLPYLDRFQHIAAYLKNKNYRYVVTTDVRDVIFQMNPIDWLEQNLVGNKKLVFCSESIKFKDEPWGRNNIAETFGEEFKNSFLDEISYNVGVIAGYVTELYNLTNDIYNLGKQAPIQVCDQAVFNKLIKSSPYLDIGIFTNSEDGFATQLGTSAVDRFQNNIIEPQPQLVGDQIQTSTGITHCIVHQYDRRPDFSKILQSKFCSNKDITIVTAYYNIGRENWIQRYKRDDNLYFEYFTILANLNNDMIVYTTQEYVEKIKEIRKDKPTKIIVCDIFSEFSELLTAIQQIHSNNEYKAKINPDLLTNPEYCFSKYSLINYVKPYFLSKAVDDRLINTSLVSWVDFGYCRSWETIQDIYKWKYEFLEDKINIFNLEYIDKNVDVEKVIANNKVYAIGSIFVCGKKICKTYWEMTQNYLNQIMSMNLVDDDQSLVAYMCSKNMNLFQQHPILEWFDVFKMYNSGWPINKHNGVVEAYKNILGRNGDYGGLKNYIHSGHSLNDIKSIFLHSEEHKLLTKDVISVNGVNYDKYFVQSVCVDNTYLHKNRMDFFLNYLTGKKVLHIGFVDWPITDVNQNLHLSLAPHCNRLDGYDINYRNEVELTVPNGTNYSEWCQVSDDYDVIIVPEVIEHIGNLEDFLKQISTKHGKLIITTPDSVLLNNRYEQIDDEGNAFEVVHPDHNCVYTPYTLKTVINKYSNKKVQSLLWVNNHSIAAICE